MPAERFAHWGRPLVTLPHPGTAWDVPADGWHLDSQDLKLTMVAVFAHLAAVRPCGGGTLVVTGSHRLTTPAGPQACHAPDRSHEVKVYLSTVHPRLLHAVAPNSLPGPRMMLLQFLHCRP